MLIEPGGIAQFLLSVFLFPQSFQNELLAFAWGMDEQLWILVAKRLLLLLPSAAVIAGCWVTIPSLVTVLFRHRRGEFITTLFLTWWDLGKSIVSFWGGILRFLFLLGGAIIGLGKLIVFGLWSIIQEVLFLPFRLFRSAGESIVRSPVPWIAVSLTLFWCVIEATIFSYVTSPLVLDTLGNITGEQLSAALVRIPLFIFLFFVVLGSYAVLSNFVTAVQSKKIAAIGRIAVIEFVVLFVEVVFLYREFVDSLVPWFAQYSEGFELGVFWTLGIAGLAWFGIRSISWFLFAADGTPTILSIIQGKGINVEASQETSKPKLVYKSELFGKIKEDTEWIKQKGDELLSAFMLPPLQVIAAVINFCILLVSGTHLFELPFTSLGSILDSKALLERAARRTGTAQEA